MALAPVLSIVEIAAVPDAVLSLIASPEELAPASPKRSRIDEYFKLSLSSSFAERNSPSPLPDVSRIWTETGARSWIWPRRLLRDEHRLTPSMRCRLRALALRNDRAPFYTRSLSYNFQSRLERRRDKAGTANSLSQDGQRCRSSEV